jgi:hypothetical protein
LRRFGVHVVGGSRTRPATLDAAPTKVVVATEARSAGEEPEVVGAFHGATDAALGNHVQNTRASGANGL